MSEAITREPTSAIPAFHLGSVVRYRDRQDRIQTGTVDRIEASWTDYGNGKKGAVLPLIIYTLGHPTYAGRRFYTTDDRIIGVSK